MKKLFKMIWITVITVIFGFSMASCGADDDKLVSIIGTWNGALTKTESGITTKHEDVTIVFTPSEFTLTSGEGEWNITGTYTASSGILGTEYTLKSNSDNKTIGTATILLTILSFSGATNSDFAKFSGTFQKEYTQPSIEPFNGTYTGTYKTSNGVPEDAELKFNSNNTWSLNSTSHDISTNGTFIRNSSISATLMSADGQATLFTAYINIFNNKKLTLSGVINTIYAGGTGSFTKQ